MSLYAGLIASFFPPSYKIAYSESSHGFKIYNSFADLIENVYFETKVFKNFGLFSNPVKQNSFLNRVSLLKKDYADDSFSYFLEPLVFDGTKRLVHVPDFSIFLNRNPERFTFKKSYDVTNFLIWESSSPSTINDIKFEEHLNIDVSGITEFISASREVMTADKQSFFGGYNLLIKGIDKFGNEISENFLIANKEPFTTRFKYKELHEVDYHGFEGVVRIYLTSKKQEYKKEILLDKYVEHNKGLRNIKISLINEQGMSFLRYEKALRIVEFLEIETHDLEKTEHIVDRLILDENDNMVEVIDFCINYQNYNVYLLTNDSRVLVVSLDLNIIQGPAEEVSSDTYLEFYKEINRCGYLEEHTMGAIFKIRKTYLKSYIIKKVSPSGIESWYDGTSWVGTATTITIPEKLWRNSGNLSFDFENHFNELGEWTFYMESEFENYGTEKIALSVYCEFIKAKKSYDLSNEAQSNFDGIFFNGKKNLCLSEGNFYKSFKQEHDTFSYSPLLNEIVLKEEINNVEVIVPFHVSSQRKNGKYYFKINSEEESSFINLREGERHCLLQMEKNGRREALFLSTESERAVALNSRYNAEYYVDGVLKTYSSYLTKARAEDYDKCEIIFNLNETLYCYSEDRSELKLVINPIGSDNFERQGVYYG